MPQTDTILITFIYSIKLNGDQERNIPNANSASDAITRFNEEQGRDLYLCDPDDEHRKGELRKYEKKLRGVKLKKAELKCTSCVGERDSS